MPRKLISAEAYMEKVKALWDESNSDWNSAAGGFVKTKIWTEKAGEIRLYTNVGKKNRRAGYAVIRPNGDEFQISFCDCKYGTQESLTAAFIEISKTFKVNSIGADKQVNENKLIASYGAFEAADAQSDVAREDWDI